MASTLLEAVNLILKRTGYIAGDAGELSTLTDSGRQRAIDLAVAVINEGIDELYSASEIDLPNEQAEDTITLVTGDRDYALPDDIVQIRWPLIDRTNGQYIFEYAGGYNKMLADDPYQNMTGLPLGAVIRPTDGLLYLDRAPSSAENGRVYTFQYDKDLSRNSANDLLPFNNAVLRGMVPAWLQLWKRDMRQSFDADLFGLSIGRASRLMTMKQARTSYNPRRGG
jgi:hypothetical protein